MTEMRQPRRLGERVIRLRGVSPDGQGALLERTRSFSPLNGLELVEQLCAVSAALSGIRRQQVRGLGLIMPHVFMAHVLARVGECIDAEGPAAKGRLRPEMLAILGVLEAAASAADFDTRQVIATSFMEDGKRLSFFAGLRPLLGQRLAALGRTGARWRPK